MKDLPPQYPHQTWGVRFLSCRPNRILADGIGVAKTRQAIDACDHLGLTRIGVVCPAIVRGHWLSEFDLWQQIPRELNALSSREMPEITDGVWVTSFALTRPFKEAIRKLGLQVLIVDEFHNLKNPKAGQTKNVLGMKKDGRGGLARHSDRMWFLSGTPCPSNPSDLWPVLRAGFPEVLPIDGRTERPLTYSSFISRYCKVKQIGVGRQQVVGGKNLADLRGRLRPIMLRRLLKDVKADLPECRVVPFNIIAGRVPGLEAAEPLLAEVLDAIESDNKSAKKRLKSQTATIRRLIGKVKGLAVADLVKGELADGLSKIVIACWHREVITALEKDFGKNLCVSIHGGTTDKIRTANRNIFKTNDKCKVMILQMQAGGTGLDGLQYVCNEGIMVEPDWTDMINVQMIGRLARTGQQMPVRWRMVSIKGSVDEHITEVAARKAKIAHDLFDADDGSVEPLSAGQVLS